MTPQAPENRTSAAAAAGVELRGVAKSFRTDGTVVAAVRGIDASVALGDTVALLGPNGAGKSTTIDMLLGLIRPDQGGVSLLGRATAGRGCRRAGGRDAPDRRAHA